MDDIKIFTKNEKGLVTRIQSIRIYILAIGMEFGTKNVLCSNEKEKKTETRNKTTKSENHSKIYSKVKLQVHDKRIPKTNRKGVQD